MDVFNTKSGINSQIVPVQLKLVINPPWLIFEFCGKRKIKLFSYYKNWSNKLFTGPEKGFSILWLHSCVVTCC